MTREEFEKEIAAITKDWGEARLDGGRVVQLIALANRQQDEIERLERSLYRAQSSAADLRINNPNSQWGDH